MKDNSNVQFNSVDNAEEFLKYNLNFAKLNNILDFTIWSNGVELVAIIDNNDIASSMQRGELKYKGFWKAFVLKNGHQESVIF